jgi:hypothetical protein
LSNVSQIVTGNLLATPVNRKVAIVVGKGIAGCYTAIPPHDHSTVSYKSALLLRAPMHTRQFQSTPHHPGVDLDRPAAGVERRARFITVKDFVAHLIGVSQDIANQDTGRAQS